MSAEEFRANVESGEVLVDCHDRVLRIAYIYIYLDDGLLDANGVFDFVDKLYTRGWSFGQGDLKFNRYDFREEPTFAKKADKPSTLDIFYLAQIAAGIYRTSDQLDGDFPLPDDFDTFYAQHHQLLNPDAWRQYYSPNFLAHATSARFYRLPDLQDLPDSGGPICQPRQKGIGHFTKLPRWAYNAMETPWRLPTITGATITQIALSTLQKNILRLRKDHPSVQPYSATQASFWLKYMENDYSRSIVQKKKWKPNRFDQYVAQGGCDIWDWEAHYSQKLWNSIEARIAPLEPDLDGTRKSEVDWCGMPDGGAGVQAWWRGWQPEVGSEEEIEFLAAVAVKETENIEESNWNYAIRSHMLLGVMRAAFETEWEKHMEDLKRWIVEAAGIGESKVKQWIQEVRMVMEPYVQKWDGWPAAVEDQSGLLRLILMENGQLFARWELSPASKEFDFELKPME